MRAEIEFYENASVTASKSAFTVDITGGIGPQGSKGDPGYTPVKGVDYFDGYTPVKGVDYFDGQDGKDGADGKDGQDGYTPIKGVDYFDGADGKDGAPGKDGADGRSPVVTASKSGTTTTISVDGTPIATVEDGSDGEDGKDGSDGHSPVVTASKSGSVTTISVDGTAIATINDGQNGSDGQDGTDGHSPLVTASKVGSVTTISVDGTAIATVNDGADGHTPVKGTDYWTASDQEGIVSDTVTAVGHAIIASEYDATATYALGDVCLKDGTLYKCTTAISTAEAWNSAHWTTITIAGDYVKNTDYATSATGGVVKVNGTGLLMDNGQIKVDIAGVSDIKAGNSFSKITPTIRQQNAVFYGLAKAAGDSTQSSSSNAVGTYTESAKTAIRSMLGVGAESVITETVTGSTPTITGVDGHRYVCGEVSTISITPPQSGIIDVIFTSGTSAAVLTLPNTVKMPAWFDATSLETDTIYEINIMDGVYGTVMTWG